MIIFYCNLTFLDKVLMTLVLGLLVELKAGTLVCFYQQTGALGRVGLFFGGPCTELLVLQNVQKTKPCTGVKFVPVEGSAVCHDYQEIKIQESMQTLGVGSVPRSIVVVLEDDLVDSTKAGGKLNAATCFFPEATLCEINELCGIPLKLSPRAHR